MAVWIDANVLTWPLTQAGGFGVCQTMAITFFLGLGLHYLFEKERAKDRPEFKIETGRIQIFNHCYRPIQREVWFRARVSNTGAPSSVKSWSVQVRFLPNVSFKLTNDQILRPWFIDFTGPQTPFGEADLRTNADVIVTNGHIEGWIGIGLMDVPTMDQYTDQSFNEGGEQFAGIDYIVLSCVDYAGGQASITLSPRRVGGGLWGESNCVVHAVYPPKQTEAPTW
jgi:hypothetical protein